MDKKDFPIGFGFVIEVMFFVIAGMLFQEKLYMPFGFVLLFGIISAWYVGVLIKKNAIEKYKRDKK